jgi:hypothetical protein
MSRGASAVAIVGGALALGALGAWLFVLRDSAEPASVDEAVTTFREQTETGEGRLSPVPEGVYVYATNGYERTDALTGVTHRYPARSTITVTGDACGFRLRWAVLKGRSTTWTICVDGPWTVTGQDERHTFFGRTERTTYTCVDTPFRPVGDRAGTTFTVSCATGSSEERGTGRVVAREAVRVGGRAIDAVHVRRRSTLTGGIRGHSSQDVWLARETGLPLRLDLTTDTSNDSAVGDVHYEERVSLRLGSLSPRR